ncbi:MAG: methyltransferase domain-containing protein [Crocosphaera sp.]|nr:methyltransferase domain-containing protein [Crocosphaera sp.]
MVLIELTKFAQKEKIAKNFNKGVANYLYYSQVQKQCAEKLLKIAQNYTDSLPKGSILEIGCGTGFVTQGLIKQFPDHFLDIIDISTEMLNYCVENLQISDAQKKFIRFRTMDGERIKADKNTYAAIISSFTVQWFQDIVNSLNRLINSLQPQGLLLLAFPNDQTFPEWKKICKELNLPFTRNQLPNTIELIQKLSIPPHKIYISEERVILNYKNAADFFKSLKVIGAGLNLKQEKVSIPEMKQLINYWNNKCYPNQIEVTYDVTFLLIQLV